MLQTASLPIFCLFVVCVEFLASAVTQPPVAPWLGLEGELLLTHFKITLDLSPITDSNPAARCCRGGLFFPKTENTRLSGRLM